MLRITLSIVVFLLCVLAVPTQASGELGLVRADPVGNLLFLPAFAVLIMHHVHHHGRRRAH